MNFKLIAVGLWVFFVSHQVGAQTFEETRTLARTFKAGPAITVEINNKYGSVVVTTWDKDSVKIEVTRKLSEKTEERFKKIKESIDFNFVSSAGLISAETVFGTKHATVIQNVKEVTNFLSAADARSRIDYRVYLPATAHLRITNKYGDVVLPSLKGNVTLDLSNGNLQARDIEGHARMMLAFGSAQIKRLRAASLNLNFVIFGCDQADRLEADSRSSQLTIGEIGQLQIASRRDQINIGNAAGVKGETYFSKVKLPNLTESCDLKMTYGELSMLTLGVGFKFCNIVSQTCDVNLMLVSPEPYNALIKAFHSKYYLPNGLKASITGSEKVIEKSPVKFVFGKVLSDDKLKLNIAEAELRIEHR